MKLKFPREKFHQSKNSIDFNLINIYKIAVSVRFELNKGDKSYIDYKDADIFRPLCILF